MGLRSDGTSIAPESQPSASANDYVHREAIHRPVPTLLTIFRETWEEERQAVGKFDRTDPTSVAKSPRLYVEYIDGDHSSHSRDLEIPLDQEVEVECMGQCF